MVLSASLLGSSRPFSGAAVEQRTCSLDFRPRRLFRCRLETVLREFFSSEELRLATLPTAARDLCAGIVRAGLDERVVVDAAFSPSEGRGVVSLRLFYRLPTTEAESIQRIIELLGRSASARGYHRFGHQGALAVRGSERVQTKIVRQFNGESYLMTRVWYRLLVQTSESRLALGAAVEGRPQG